MEDAPYRTVEIYYDMLVLPRGFKSALDFRNEAMHRIEAALQDNNAGEWEGADIGTDPATGRPEVNFGFEVQSFETAERIVHEAVQGTPFDCIREIARYEEGEPA